MNKHDREQRRALLNFSGLLVGLVLGMWWTLSHADYCDTNPTQCVMTPTGPALVINICGAGAGTGTCTTEQGATQAGSDDPLAMGRTVGNVKVGPVTSELARIPVDPATPLPTPPGWSGPNSPPATVSQAITGCSWFNGSISGTFASAADCVNQLTSASGPSGGCPALDCDTAPGNQACSCTVTGCASGSCSITRTGGNSGGTNTASYNTGCPAGYTASGGNCNLSNANLVAKPPDSNCGIVRTGNTFSFDSRDTDCTSTQAADGGVSASGDTAQAGTVRQNVKVKANADGTTEVTVSTVNSRGNTDVTEARVDGTGKVIGAAKYTNIGNGSLAGLGGQSQGGDCADCAKESTLQGLRNDLITGLGAKINEQDSLWSSARGDAASKQQAARDAMDARTTAYNAAKASGDAGQMGVDGLTQFAAPTSHEMTLLGALFPSPVACAPLVFTGGSGPRNYAMTLDVCPTVDYVRPLLDWFMAGLTIMYIYFAFWRRRQASKEA